MATVSTVAASLAPWSAVKSRSFCSPSASLVYLGGSTRSPLSLSAASASTGPAFLQTSFVPSSSSLTSSSPFSGRPLGLDLTCNIGPRKDRGFRLVVRAGKPALCLTKRNRSRKSLARTHGFRRRMRTTSGRAMLKRRRDKGRRILCTKTNPNSGKRS